jgi:cold-inducible RNA-binding protein
VHFKISVLPLSVFVRIRLIRECLLAALFRTLLWFRFPKRSPTETINLKEIQMTNIFVGNLSFQTTQEELHAAFASYGTVERVNIVTDRDSGQARGFAFVEMTERKDAENAISVLNGSELNGRAINVNEARPKPQGGGGGGRSGGGRNRW